jgi:hypothetical protein
LLGTDPAQQLGDQLVVRRVVATVGVGQKVLTQCPGGSVWAVDNHGTGQGTRPLTTRLSVSASGIRLTAKARKLYGVAQPGTRRLLRELRIGHPQGRLLSCATQLRIPNVSGISDGHPPQLMRVKIAQGQQSAGDELIEGSGEMARRQRAAIQVVIA